MSKIIIDEKVLASYNMDIKEMILYLYYKYKVNPGVIKRKHPEWYDVTINKIDSVQFINTKPSGFLTKLCEEILSASGSEITEDKGDCFIYNLEELAERLKEVFPKGKKEGSNQTWSEGTSLIVRRLQLFHKKFKKDVTAEDIIKAAENYVNSFNGIYTYMRTLKYFIFKNEIKGGEVELTSDLLNYLENVDSDTILNNDWTADLV